MIQGRDFLTLAGKLAAGGTEAEWRSAISRAYYAAFHVAREFMSKCGFTIPKGDRAHAYLWRRLTNADVIQLLNVTATHPIKSDVIDAIRIYERDVLKEVTWSGP